MDSLNYKLSTSWAEVKTRLSGPLQASYELGGDQNGPSQHLPTYLAVVKTGSAKFYKSPTR